MILLRGSHGFIGSRIKERFNTTVIPRSLKIPKGKFDTLIYCAGYGNMHYQTDESNIWKVNFGDFLTLRSKSDFKTVYFSTSNGNQAYLKSKRRAEALADIVIRPYSVTGVGEQPEHLIPTAIDCLLTGRLLQLDPSPVHDFIDIEDLLDALEVILNSKEKGIFEIGTGVEHSNIEVVELISKLAHKRIIYQSVKNIRSYDKKSWKADITRLTSLGWKPKKSLEQSIKEQLDAYKN